MNLTTISVFFVPDKDSDPKIYPIVAIDNHNGQSINFHYRVTNASLDRIADLARRMNKYQKFHPFISKSGWAAQIERPFETGHICPYCTKPIMNNEDVVNSLKSLWHAACVDRKLENERQYQEVAG